MSTIHNLTATMADGKSWDVVADQRDIAEFEVHPDGLPFYALQQKPFTYIRFCAWHAGRREKLHSLSWEEFKDQCVEVQDRDRLIGEEASDPDPGSPAPSAGS